MMIKKDAGQQDSIHDPRFNDDKINEPTISFKNEE